VERERGGTRPLGAVLKDVMKGVAPVRTELQELMNVWMRVAGAEIAARAHVVGIKHDTLTVSVESAAMKQEIESFHKAGILERLKTEFVRRRIAKLRCVMR